MKLTEVGSAVLYGMTKDAGRDESNAVGELLDRLPQELRFDIDRAVGSYVSEMLEAGFLAGLAVGRDPLAWLTEVQASTPPTEQPC